MSLPLFTRLGLGLGIGLSAASTLHPLSPFRTAPMQCQYTAPYYRPEGPASPEAGWAVNPSDPILQKQGRSGVHGNAAGGFLTTSNMKQVSLGSVLGLVAGVGLRAFSRVLVVVLGMGVVLAEVCFFSWFYLFCLLLLLVLVSLWVVTDGDIVGCIEGVQYPSGGPVAAICQER